MADTPLGNSVQLPRNARLYAYIALAALALFLLYRVRTVLPPFIIGLIIAYILDPWLDRLQARGWSRTRAIGLVYVIFFLTSAIFLILVLPPVIGYLGSSVERAQVVAQDLAGLMDAQSLEELEGRLAEKWPWLGERINIDWEAYGPRLEEWRVGLIETARTKAPQWAQSAGQAVLRLIAGSVATLMTLFFIPITAYYFSREIDPLRARVVTWVPTQYRDDVFSCSQKINSMLSSFFRGQLTLMALVGLSAFVSLNIVARFWHLETGAVLLLSLWYGGTYCIPYVGAISSCALAGVTCFVASEYSLVCALVVLGIFIGINMIFDNIITPKIVGDRIGLHPLVVLFAIFAGFHVLGILGMIIAAPIAASVRITINQFMPELFARLPSEADEKPEEADAQEADAAPETAEGADVPETKAPGNDTDGKPEQTGNDAEQD